MMHEYGHTFQSRIFGPAYLLAIGTPSIFSAESSKIIDHPDNVNDWKTHGVRWYERQANKHAAKYFGKYGVTWDDKKFPRSRPSFKY